MVTGLNRDETLTVLYDADCGICTQVSRALVRLDPRRRLVLLPLQSALIAGAPSREAIGFEHAPLLRRSAGRVATVRHRIRPL
jgi:predicted DCC family thiol-disulfide oxidoreductase YuxK